MVTTTLAVVALAGALSTGASPTPSWQTDYSQAMASASAEQKPIAVFIGQGSKKPGEMMADGAMPEDAARLLKESYICLFIDTETASGKQLASQFAMSEGLVISSPGGTVQALRHNGPLNGTELTRHLSQYANAGQPVTTVTTGVGAPATFVRTCSGGNCYLNYSSTPSNYSTNGSVVYPASYGSFGSSCPNGRCPYQR
jgi:hypothetical protein